PNVVIQKTNLIASHHEIAPDLPVTLVAAKLPNDPTRRSQHGVVFKTKGETMDNRKLKGKVGIVTGASKGIGAGIAKYLAAAGVSVVVNYASAKKDADQVVNEITREGGRAIAVQGDVAKKKDIEHLFSETKKAFGRLDVLVNNAGVYQFAPLEETTEEE